MNTNRSPLRWLLLLMLIGIAVVLSGQLAPEGLPRRAYGVRDYVRGDSLIAVRLPHTTDSDGLVTLTTDQRVIGTDSKFVSKLSKHDFATLMEFRRQWCPKPSDTPRDTEQTPHYVVGLQCERFTRQFEFPSDQVPPEIQLLLRVGHA